MSERTPDLEHVVSIQHSGRVTAVLERMNLWSSLCRADRAEAVGTACRAGGGSRIRNRVFYFSNIVLINV